MSPAIWIGLFVVAFVVILILRAKGESRIGADLVQPTIPQRDSSVAGHHLDKEHRDRLLQALQSGDRAEAVKLYIEVTGASSEDASQNIERLAKLVGMVGLKVEASTGSREPDWESIEEQLIAGNKIEAIKLFREQTGADLKQAKDAVDAYEAANKEKF